MDSLDSRLLRASFRGGIFVLAGIDPRRTVTELADAAKVSRLTVRHRLRRWADSGFWGPTVVFPNPDLLDRAFFFQGYLVEEPQSLTKFEAAIRQCPCVAFAFQVQQQFYGVLELASTAKGAASTVKRLERIPHVRAQFAPVPVRFPASKRSMRPADWAIVREFRRVRAIDWRQVASNARLTPQRLRRRVAQLIDGDQLFFFPELDFRRSEGSVALCTLFFSPDANEAEIRRELLDEYPDMIEVENLYPAQIAIPPALRGPYSLTEHPTSAVQVPFAFSFFLPLGSIALGDDLHRELARIPRVFHAIITYPVHNFEAPGCFDAQVARMAN
jgi:DNA-binding Lrp family transcriptional regulator